MIAHPDDDLIGVDISTIVDKNGYELGKEILNIAETTGEGFINYYWQTKDKIDEPLPKITYVTIIGEKDWILCSGVYINDIKNETRHHTGDILKFIIINMLIISLLIIILIKVGTKFENQKKSIERIFRKLIENLSIGVFRLSLQENKKIITNNKAFLNILGIEKDNIFQKNIEITKYFNNEETKQQFIKSIDNLENIEETEVEITNEKGEKLWVRIEGNITKEDKSFYFDGYIENISESHRTHELLEKSYTKLQRTDGMKNEIIGITSHELRTPLTIIKGFASILEGGKIGKLNKEQITYIGKISNNTDKLLIMINNMLDLSKLEAGELVFEPEPINIREMVMQIYEDFILDLKKEEKIINIDIPEEKIIVEYDSLQLKRVLVNLIGNAIKFIEPKTGVIDIIIKRKDDETINITIKDNGIGISMKNINDIFLKFKQVGGHMKRISEGTGLGLPIVKSVLKQMGSDIKVKSKVGKGSEFSFSLKVKKINI